MVTVTIVVQYIERGQQRETEITANAKTYSEAYHKASKAADEFGELLTVTNIFVKSIQYS